MPQPSKQRILITGAAVRIGRGIAEAFAEAGADLIVHCRHSQSAGAALVEQLRQRTGGEHQLVQCDLTDAGERRQMLADIVAGGPLHGLINNASVYRRRELRDLELDQLRHDYEINFIAPFDLMRGFAQLCGRGWIINLLDQRVALVDPGAGAYALAKKSLRDATEAAALEWAPAIRVNAVAPGFVMAPPGVDPAKMTPLLRHVPMQKASTAAEIAAACRYLAEAETVTGTTIFVDGGLHLGRPPIAEYTPAPGISRSS